VNPGGVEWVIGKQFSLWHFLLMVNVILFFAGNFMDMPLCDVLRAALPWILVIVFVLSISTFMPKLMYGMHY
jgi:TRAP-type C4-dicarboxylate transport system permease large subunit